MINIVKTGDFVKFIELKHHHIHKVMQVNRKNKGKETVNIQCQHCNMKIYHIPYFLMEIVIEPGRLLKSVFPAVKYR